MTWYLRNNAIDKYRNAKQVCNRLECRDRRRAKPQRPICRFDCACHSAHVAFCCGKGGGCPPFPLSLSLFLSGYAGFSMMPHKSSTQAVDAKIVTLKTAGLRRVHRFDPPSILAAAIRARWDWDLN